MREDVIALYGFATPLEQDLFERLIAISGIGPKLALAVLSGIEPADLVRAIRDAGRRAADADSGVGKKTAERIGLELKDRLPRRAGRRVGRRRRAGGDQLRDDLLSALMNLGYQRAAVPRRRSTTAARSRDVGFEQALRGRACVTLTRGRTEHDVDGEDRREP